MMGKKGPLAGVRIKNVTDGTEKVSPAFVLKAYYELAGRPGAPDDLPARGGRRRRRPEARGRRVRVAQEVGRGRGRGGEHPDAGGQDPRGRLLAAENTPGTDDALDALEPMPDCEYEKLNDADLQRVYETAEDVNWHTVAGKA